MSYAGFWIRFLATIIDGIIMLLPSLVITKTYGDITFSISANLIVNFFYFPFFESSALSATPGKAILGLAVVSEGGGPLTFKQACIRYFCKYLSMLIAYIGYLMQPFTARRQTLHDMISEAVVIKQDAPRDMNYFRVWVDQIKFVFNKL